MLNLYQKRTYFAFKSDFFIQRIFISTLRLQESMSQLVKPADNKIRDTEIHKSVLSLREGPNMCGTI